MPCSGTKETVSFAPMSPRCLFDRKPATKYASDGNQEESDVGITKTAWTAKKAQRGVESTFTAMPNMAHGWPLRSQDLADFGFLPFK